MTHRMVLDSIAARDPIGAQNAMTMHLAFNRCRIKQLYDAEHKT